MTHQIATHTSFAAGQAATSPSGTRVRSLVRQAAWFVAIGAASTGVNAALYLLLRQSWSMVTATVVALGVSTVGSTEANRLLTFAGSNTTRSSLNTQSLLVFLFYCFYGTATLAALHLLVADATPQAEVIALSLASMLGGIGRFLLLRSWVFGRPVGDKGVRPLGRHECSADGWCSR